MLEEIIRKFANTIGAKELTLSMILIQSNHLVDRLDRSAATPLGLPNLFWVAALVLEEVVNVEHLDLLCSF